MGRGLSVIGLVGATALACGNSYGDGAGENTVDGGAKPAVAKTVVVPDGWLLVAVVASRAGGGAGSDASATPACPAYFTEPRELVERPRGGTACTCACGAPKSNPCAYGAMAISFNGGACGQDKGAVVADGSCEDRGDRDIPDTRATPLAPKQVDCAVTSTLSLEDDGAVSVCTSPPPTACPEGACVTPPPDTKTCLLREGDLPCPDKWPTRRVMTARADVVDTRVCEGCTCTTTATSCENAALTYYDDDKCTVNPRAVVVNTECVKAPAGDARYRRYTATPKPDACAPKTPTVEAKGTLTIPTAVKTFCCP